MLIAEKKDHTPAYCEYLSRVVVEAAIEKLQAAVAKVMKSPEVIKRMETSGIRPMSMEPKDTERFVKAESEKWAQFLRNAGIKAE